MVSQVRSGQVSQSVSQESLTVGSKLGWCGQSVSVWSVSRSVWSISQSGRSVRQLGQVSKVRQESATVSSQIGQSVNQESLVSQSLGFFSQSVR